MTDAELLALKERAQRIVDGRSRGDDDWLPLDLCVAILNLLRRLGEAERANRDMLPAETQRALEHRADAAGEGTT